MKNSFKLLLVFFVIFSFTSCEEDLIVYDADNGITAVSFGQTSYSVIVPLEDISIDIPVDVTTKSASDRSFAVNVVSSTTTTPSEYSIGSITVPAGSYNGALTVGFDFSEISGDDGEVKQLDLQISDIDSGNVFNELVSIEYFREIVCNDLELTITTDIWASETYFTLEEADGTVIVERFFPFGGNSLTSQTYTVQFNLPDGDYVFKLGDSYGDGQFSTNAGITYIGTYSLSCSIITHASGDGEFATSVADPFPGNAGATVEVTSFSVNP